MTVATLTTWRRKPGVSLDEARTHFHEHGAPGLRALGATGITVVRTGEDTVTMVTLWPDDATYAAARDRLAAMRGEAKSERLELIDGSLEFDWRDGAG